MDREGQEESAPGDVGVRGSFTVHLASQGMEVQGGLGRVLSGGPRANIIMGDSGSICGKNKRLRLAIMGQCGMPGRGWDLPLGVQVILLLRP